MVSVKFGCLHTPDARALESKVRSHFLIDKECYAMPERCSFISQPFISYDDTRRLVLIDNCVLRFGPSLYTLVKLLLEHQEISDVALSLALYHQANDRNRKLMTRNISKLRTKLTTHGLDIQRILNQGYRLVALPEAAREVTDEVKRA
jgi:DNA-binding response OmpR family regulator